MPKGQFGPARIAHPRMDRFSVKDRIAATHVRFMLHDYLYVLLVSNVHETARCEVVGDQDF
jgi:hypothetical protein